MKDKFADYYNTPERIDELSEYVHQNFCIIQTKMISEMRRKLDITADRDNIDGYSSLMISLYGRMFNEMVYGLCGFCQTYRMHPKQIVPIVTMKILLNLFEGQNPLNGLPRDDVKSNRDDFVNMYNDCIDDLRSVIEALPK
jgi:hypothetical protein